MGTEDQRNSENRGPVGGGGEGVRGTVGPEDQWVQRTRGIVGLETQWVQRPEKK